MATWKNRILWLFIILAAYVLRFTNYSQRWALAYDQARDAIIARQVLSGKPMPALGPFSSAGNFTTGPVWYWFTVAASAVYPHVLTPWVVMTGSYVGIVAILMLVGFTIGGVSLAVILGLYAAVSPGQIDQGFNLTNPSLVAICASIVVFAGVRYMKTGHRVLLFLLALGTGAAIAAHFQSALLLVYVGGALLFHRPSVKHMLLFILLLMLPFLPLIVFDITHDYYNFRGVIDYLTYGQYNVYVPNRWLTYAGQFIPHLWSVVLGGHPLSGYVIMSVVGISLILAYIARLFTPISLNLLCSFALMIIALRYYRGERFESYFVFLHPFILTISAWSTWIIYRKQKLLGILTVLLVVGTSIWMVVPNIGKAKNWTAWRCAQWIQLLTTTYPGTQFDLYDFDYQGTSYSVPLSLFMDQAGLLSDSGYKIGFGNPPSQTMSGHTEIAGNTGGFNLWDLESSSSAQLIENKWRNINPNYIYHGVVEWYEGKDL